MNIWIILTVLFGAISVTFAVIGAAKSREGALGVIANLSIPLFFVTFIGLYSIPFQSGWNHQTGWKILGVGVMVMVAAITGISNHLHNKIMLENIKKGKFYR